MLYNKISLNYLAINVQTAVTLYCVVTKLWDFNLWKIGQNYHGGFSQRQSKLSITMIRCFAIMKVVVNRELDLCIQHCHNVTNHDQYDIFPAMIYIPCTCCSDVSTKGWFLLLPVLSGKNTFTCIRQIKGNPLQQIGIFNMDAISFQCRCKTVVHI